MTQASPLPFRNPIPIRAGMLLMLTGLLAWDFVPGATLLHHVWYVPLVVLAQLQHSRRLANIITLLAISAVWLGSFLPRGMFPLSPTLMAHCLTVSMALLAVHAGFRYYLLKSEAIRETWERQSRQEHDMAALTESLPLHLWSATPDGRINFFTQRLVTLTGRCRDDIQADWLLLLHPDDQAQTLALWSHCVETGQNYETEVRIRDTSGRYIWHLLRAVPKRDDHGRISRWLGSAQDIDHIRALRAEAQALAGRLNNTLESITDALFALDEDHRFTYVNAKAANVLGLPCNELPGKPIAEVLHGDSDNPFVKYSRQAMQEQRLIHVQEWYAPRQLWLDIRLYPSRDGVTAYFLDITRQRDEETELRLLRTGVSRLNDIIMITEAHPLDEPGPRIIFINEAFERITGYRPAEVLGRNPRFLQGAETQPEEIRRIRNALERCEPVRAQVINYKKTGEPFWLEIDIAPIADAEGRYTHFVSVERDVTERKAMANRLQQAQRMEAVGLLTGGLAHDFNNLLTVVMGNADMLAEALQDNTDLAPLAKTIVQAADCGASLVRSLLAFARRQALMPGNVAVDAMIEELKPILEASLTQKHRLQVRVDGPLWTAYVDRSQLESALINLVINARDAMLVSGRLTIALSNARLDDGYVSQHAEVIPGEYVQITISDTGTGIPRQDIDRIFEPFYSTKSVGRGSGLGLSSVFGFIKQSGGHIVVESTPDAGSTFRLYLPRSRVQGEAIATPAADDAIAARSDGHYILVVEDEDGIRRLAVQYLERAGYRIQEAANGEEALDLIRQGTTPDLIFTDVVMPGSMSGPELVQAARQYLPAVPVLYASGFAEKSGLLPEDLGSNEYFLAKPYRRKQLLAKVEQLLGRTDAS